MGDISNGVANTLPAKKEKKNNFISNSDPHHWIRIRIQTFCWYRFRIQAVAQSRSNPDSDPDQGFFNFYDRENIFWSKNIIYVLLNPLQMTFRLQEKSPAQQRTNSSNMKFLHFLCGPILTCLDPDWIHVSVLIRICLPIWSDPIQSGSETLILMHMFISKSCIGFCIKRK